MSALIALLLESVAYVGLEELRDRFIGQSRKKVVDPLAGEASGQLHSNFVATGELTPSWILVHVQRGGNWEVTMPVRYGETLRLRVPLGRHEVTAAFFADAPERDGLPTLVALAQEIVMVTSTKPEKFRLRGEAPTDDVVDVLKSAAVQLGGLPFRLPGNVPAAITAAPEPARDIELPAPPQRPVLEIVSEFTCTFRGRDGGRCGRSPVAGDGLCQEHSAVVEPDERMQIVAWTGYRK